MTHTPALEAQMRRFYASLSEKGRRHRPAAIATAKLGYGGRAYVAAVLGGDPKPADRLRCDEVKLQVGELRGEATPNQQIVFDATLPRWNCRACPSGP